MEWSLETDLIKWSLKSNCKLNGRPTDDGDINYGGGGSGSGDCGGDDGSYYGMAVMMVMVVMVVMEVVIMMKWGRW